MATSHTKDTEDKPLVLLKIANDHEKEMFLLEIWDKSKQVYMDPDIISAVFQCQLVLPSPPMLSATEIEKCGASTCWYRMNTLSLDTFMSKIAPLISEKYPHIIPLQYRDTESHDKIATVIGAGVSSLASLCKICLSATSAFFSVIKFPLTRMSSDAQQVLSQIKSPPPPSHKSPSDRVLRVPERKRRKPEAPPTLHPSIQREYVTKFKNALQLNTANQQEPRQAIKYPQIISKESTVEPKEKIRSVRRIHGNAPFVSAGDEIYRSPLLPTKTSNRIYIRFVQQHQYLLHKNSNPEDCIKCGRHIANKIGQLMFSQRKRLEYRDVVVLCSNPYKKMDGDDGQSTIGLIQGLNLRNVPLHVFTQSEQENDISTKTLCVENAIIVSNYSMKYAFDRKVVFFVSDGSRNADFELLQVRTNLHNTEHLILVERSKSSADRHIIFEEMDYASDSETGTNSELVYKRDDQHQNDMSQVDSCWQISDIICQSKDPVNMDNVSMDKYVTSEDSILNCPDSVISLKSWRSSEISPETAEGEKEDFYLKKDLTTNQTQVPSVSLVRNSSKPLFQKEWQTFSEFSSKGGQLQGDCSDVILYIPSNAIQGGKLITINCAICTKFDRINKVLQLNEKETIVAPVAEYYAGENFVFKKPARVVFPHFLPPTYSADQVRVYRLHKDKVGRLQKETLQFISLTEENIIPELVTDTCGLFYITRDERINVLTNHFSAIVCTYCKKDFEPFHLRLRLYGSHRKLHKQTVKICLFIWDARLEIKDFQQDILTDQEREMRFIMVEQLNVRDQYENLELGVRITLVEEQEQHWMHSEIRGRKHFPVEWRKKLQDIFCGCSKGLPLRISWSLHEKPDMKPFPSFECFVEAGYIKNSDAFPVFFEDTDMVVLHVDNLRVENQGEANHGNYNVNGSPDEKASNAVCALESQSSTNQVYNFNGKVRYVALGVNNVREAICQDVDYAMPALPGPTTMGTDESSQITKPKMLLDNDRVQEAFEFPRQNGLESEVADHTPNGGALLPLPQNSENSTSSNLSDVNHLSGPDLENANQLLIKTTISSKNELSNYTELDIKSPIPCSDNQNEMN